MGSNSFIALWAQEAAEKYAFKTVSPPGGRGWGSYREIQDLLVLTGMGSVLPASFVSFSRWHPVAETKGEEGRLAEESRFTIQLC